MVKLDTINERVKYIRKSNNLTQKDFSIRIRVKQNTVSYMEKNGSTVTEQNIFTICNEFDVNVDWLKEGKGDIWKQLTDSQKVMKYTAMLLKDADSVIASAIKAFIVTYEQLDDAGKETIDNIAVQYLDNLKKSK